jgi:hypothetical protein
VSGLTSSVRTAARNPLRTEPGLVIGKLSLEGTAGRGISNRTKYRV